VIIKGLLSGYCEDIGPITGSLLSGYEWLWVAIKGLLSGYCAYWAAIAGLVIEWLLSGYGVAI